MRSIALKEEMKVCEPNVGISTTLLGLANSLSRLVYNSFKSFSFRNWGIRLMDVVCVMLLSLILKTFSLSCSLIAVYFCPCDAGFISTFIWNFII